jgi:hypothetical protein
MAVECIAYLNNGEYDPNGYHLFTGSDAAVDAEWTQLSSTTPGVMTAGNTVVWAQKYTGAVLNTPPPGATSPTIVQSGTVAATYGSQPAVPKDVKGGDGVITLATGANNNIPAYQYLNVIQGPGGAFNVTGIAGGVDGKTCVLINNVAQNMTITNDSGSSAAPNRIYTYGATVTTGTGVVTLVYSGPLAHWVVQSFTV